MIECKKHHRVLPECCHTATDDLTKFEMRQTEGRLYTPSSVPFGEKNLTDARAAHLKVLQGEDKNWRTFCIISLRGNLENP